VCSPAELLRRLPSAATSPWSWPVVLLAAVAAAGHWGGVTAAEIAAAVCGAIGVGVLIGMTVAGYRGSPSQHKKAPPETGSAKARPTPEPLQGSASGKDGEGAGPGPPRGADLRGARLVDALLVHADLRQADLRGAILTGADLSGADLTGARLGPLDENSKGAPPA
jgi:Pentapeptide repeats (8 copies)